MSDPSRLLIFQPDVHILYWVLKEGLGKPCMLLELRNMAPWLCSISTLLLPKKSPGLFFEILNS